MQIVYRAHNLVDAHLARHWLEEADIPAFVLGESLLGAGGELPLFGVLRVCVPDGYEQEAGAIMARMAVEMAAIDTDAGDLDALPAAG